MPAKQTVCLFHWKAEEAAPLIDKLRGAGYKVAYHERPGGIAKKTLKEADAAVIDLSRLPSQGRAVAAWLRAGKSTRQIPLVFVGGEPAKVALIRKQIPD